MILLIHITNTYTYKKMKEHEKANVKFDISDKMCLLYSVARKLKDGHWFYFYCWLFRNQGTYFLTRH